MAIPSGSTNTGVYFRYPNIRVTESPTSYWLAAGGRYVRMTPSCKNALLASFEAVMERSVAPANVGSSVSSEAVLLCADIRPYGLSCMSLTDLGTWTDMSARNELKDILVRGCPKEEWDNFVERTWGLWDGGEYHLNWTNSAGVTNNGHVMYWQDRPMYCQTGGWIPQQMTVGVPWIYDLGTAAADDQVADGNTRTWSPWGQYEGPQYPNGQATQWLIARLEDMGGTGDSGTPGTFTFLGNDGLFSNGTSYMQPLSAGHLGNWTDGSDSTSIRRTSTGWAMFQSMLASMKYTHLRFNFEVTYRNLAETRTVYRHFYFDPSDWKFHITQDYDYTSQTITYSNNELHSGGNISRLEGSLGARWEFQIVKGPDEEELVRDTPPQDSQITINANEYCVDFKYQLGGANEVTLYRDRTDGIVSVDCSMKDQYPGIAFNGMAQPQGVTFIDCKSNLISAMDYDYSYAVWNEPGSTYLSTTVETHARTLLNEIAPARSWPTIAAPNDAAVQAVGGQWWHLWKLVYTNTPNWPTGNPTKYFPYGLMNPTGQVVNWTEQNDMWTCEHGGFFGDFDMAFPDYPFGWNSETSQWIYQCDEALAGYQWNFRAMTA